MTTETAFANVTLTITHEIPEERVRDLLCSAWEGGSSYWCRMVESTCTPEAAQIIADKKKTGNFYGHERPFIEGCEIVLEETCDEEEWAIYYVSTGELVKDGFDNEILARKWINKRENRIHDNIDQYEVKPTAPRWTLNRAKLIAGLQIMATKYPRHFAEFLNENDDAETADVYLQCCVLGEIVYG